ncbi:hypothetical protein [Embleya sp. AB8]|uniref:hypothetical protein n=1 Tax=Embleya sp. AB8 TaxID=3156304 RepID=UPI003C70AD1C
MARRRMAPLTRLLATEPWLRRPTGPVDAGPAEPDCPDRPARKATAPGAGAEAEEAESPARAVRFATDVTVAVDDRTDDGAVLIRGGRPHAPAGSPPALLVLQAHVEYQLRANDRDPDFDIGVFWSHPERRADLDAALATYPKDGAGRNPTWLHDLSVLTFCLAMSDRWIDLAVRFAAADNSVYEYPWYYTSRGFLAVAFRNSQEALAPRRD